MSINLFQTETKTSSWGLTAALLHLDAFGLFFFGILDSLPLPIFTGSDTLTVILAASQHDPWY